MPPGKPVSLDNYTCYSSLESCHMCSNYVRRQGITKLGFLQADPMQLDALAITAALLDMQVLRPSPALRPVAEAIEQHFNLSEYPEAEITTYLGSQEFRGLLDDLVGRKATALPEGGEAAKFLAKFGHLYPGCVLVGQDGGGGNNSNKGDNEDEDDDGMFVATSSLLVDCEGRDDEEEEENQNSDSGSSK